MNVYNEKEYNSVILGALLHDVGKFPMKFQEKNSKEHPDFSEDFFIENCEPYLKDKIDWIDIKYVKTFLKAHHIHNSFPDPNRVDKLLNNSNEEKKIRSLAFIVHVADCISSSERYSRKEDSKKGVKKLNRQDRPFESIFHDIQLFEGDLTQSMAYKYQINIQNPPDIFPEEISETNKENTETTYNNFCDIIKKLKADSFEDYYNSLLSILEKYLWIVPSALDMPVADISLYDHLKTTSAITSVLFKFHESKNDFNENLIKKHSYKMLLLGGRLSGIQNYLFNLTNIGQGGMAKRLRGRSFYLSILVETVILKILNYFKLPLSCNLYSTGGNFLILLPNIEKIDDSLTELRNEILMELKEKHFYQINLILDWHKFEAEQIPQEAIKSSEMIFKYEDYAVYNFFKTAENIHNQLEIEKNKEFSVILANDKKWIENHFMNLETYKNYANTEEGDCKVCKKGPALKYDNSENQKTRDEDNPKLCNICYEDKYNIGAKLVKDKDVFVIFSKNSLNNDSFKIFKDYYITIANEINNNFSKVYLIYKININNNQKNETYQKGVINKYLATHIPKFNDENEKKNYCEKNCQKVECDILKDTLTLSFECIATKGKKFVDGEVVPYGNYLGILKVDIDKLGMIFARGFKFNKKKTDIENYVNEEFYSLDRKTVSRYLTLSRMIELFFSGWVEYSLNQKNYQIQLNGKSITMDFTNIYTVFSGGDDLLLIGQWETIIYYARELNLQFRRFTCNNPNITLSAGLILTKPKFPLNRSVENVNEYLKKSKELEGDSLTIFDTTIKWEELDNNILIHELLNKYLKSEQQIVTTSLLHRLLKYQNDYILGTKKGITERLIYHSKLSYDIQRNILGKIQNEDLEDFKKSPLMSYFNSLSCVSTANGLTNIYMENLKIPVCWTLYKNRRNKIAG